MNSENGVADASAQRAAPEIDGIAEDWVTTLAELDPAVATWIGMPGRLDEYEDLSPDGHQRLVDETRKVLARLATATSVDDTDWIT
ncbi:MAG: DUF885 domain-containing protein, partial [Salinibacterium sp.]|nr:DUF885 domain-containing protein [Salinibacterium sp.]